MLSAQAQKGHAMSSPSDAVHVRQQVDALLAKVTALGEGPAPDPTILASALRDLDALRELYAQSPAPFADRIDLLRQARTTLDALLARHEGAIAEAFVKASDAVKQAENRRDDCRSLLLRLNGTRGTHRWAVGNMDVAVQPFTSPDLPESGTPGRIALEQYLEQHGYWRRVSILHRPALVKAIEGGVFGEQDRKALEQWCRIGVGFRVSIRERVGEPPLPEAPPFV